MMLLGTNVKVLGKKKRVRVLLRGLTKSVLRTMGVIDGGRGVHTCAAAYTNAARASPGLGSARSAFSLANRSAALRARGGNGGGRRYIDTNTQPLGEGTRKHTRTHTRIHSRTRARTRIHAGTQTHRRKQAPAHKHQLKSARAHSAQTQKPACTEAHSYRHRRRPHLGNEYSAMKPLRAMSSGEAGV
jgi:hypothetical protein